MALDRTDQFVCGLMAASRSASARAAKLTTLSGTFGANVATRPRTANGEFEDIGEPFPVGNGPVELREPADLLTQVDG